jgi:hypothetical protein
VVRRAIQRRESKADAGKTASAHRIHYHHPTILRGCVLQQPSACH